MASKTHAATEIRLSQAPDILFDLVLWNKFCAQFDTREIALARISIPPWDPAGFHRDGDPVLPVDRQEREEQIQKTYDLGRG